MIAYIPVNPDDERKTMRTEISFSIPAVALPESLVECALLCVHTGAVLVTGSFDDGHYILYARVGLDRYDYDAATPGFITSTGRFVDRKQAYEICLAYDAFHKQDRASYVESDYVTSCDAVNFS